MRLGDTGLTPTKNNEEENKMKNRKETYPLELAGKPTIEEISAGVPLTLKLLPESPKDMPMLADSEHCGKSYKVKDGSYYRLRLGIHSNPMGTGTIPWDSVSACLIPTQPDKTHQVAAIFSLPEIYPAVFTDYVTLCSDKKPFVLEYIYGSAILEQNGVSSGLALGDESVSIEDDMVIICHSPSDSSIPKGCIFNYDFISFQVKTVFAK